MATRPKLTSLDQGAKTRIQRVIFNKLGQGEPARKMYSSVLRIMERFTQSQRQQPVQIRNTRERREKVAALARSLRRVHHQMRVVSNDGVAFNAFAKEWKRDPRDGTGHPHITRALPNFTFPTPLILALADVSDRVAKSLRGEAGANPHGKRNAIVAEIARTYTQHTGEVATASRNGAFAAIVAATFDLDVKTMSAVDWIKAGITLNKQNQQRGFSYIYQMRITMKSAEN